MGDPRSMRWDEAAWRALLRVLAYVPPAVRMEALTSVVREAEELAGSRGRGEVGAPELLEAVGRRAPVGFRDVAVDLLSRELGVGAGGEDGRGG